MREDLQFELEEDFFFMRRNMAIADGEKIDNIYQYRGCECASGWYQLIHDLCQAITDRYAQDDILIDFVPEQVKEKFASLRFYYSYEGIPCSLQAIDFLGDYSLRFKPYDENEDDDKKNLRRDISIIVRSFENLSKTICEICGKEGMFRVDMVWKKTLCDDCFSNYFRTI